MDVEYPHSMEIVIEGPVPSETKDRAAAGEMGQYLLYALDVYRTPECAREDKAEIDLERNVRDAFNSSAQRSAISGGRYFSSRFYEIRSLIHDEEMESFSSIDEVLAALSPDSKYAHNLNTVSERSVLIDDVECAYIATPLTESELSQLERGPQKSNAS